MSRGTETVALDPRAQAEALAAALTGMSTMISGAAVIARPRSLLP